MDRDEVEVHKLAKEKNEVNMPAHCAQQPIRARVLLYHIIIRLDIDQVLFWVFMDRGGVQVQKLDLEKNE